MKAHRVPWLLAGAVGLLIGFGAGPASGAVAKLITGRDIKNGSIALVDLSPSARAALRGGVGPAGPAGPTGPAGASGGFDPAKIVYVEGSSASASTGNIRSSVAACPAGARVVGGGFNVTSANTNDFGVRESRARDASGWYVTMGLAISGGSVDFHATAICVLP